MLPSFSPSAASDGRLGACFSNSASPASSRRCATMGSCIKYQRISYFLLVLMTILCQESLDSNAQESSAEVVLSQSRKSCLKTELSSLDSVFFSMEEVYKSLKNISRTLASKRPPIHIVTPCLDVFPAHQLASQLTSLLRRSRRSHSTGADDTRTTFNGTGHSEKNVSVSPNKQPTPEARRSEMRKDLMRNETQLASSRVHAFLYSCNGCSPASTHGSYLSRAVAAILNYTHVCRHYLFYQGKPSIEDFMQIKNCPKIVYDISNLSSAQVSDVISSLDVSDSAVVLAAGARNRDIFIKMKDMPTSIYVKVFVVINETGDSSSSWNEISRFGDRLVMLNINGVTKTKCLSLSKPDPRVKIDIQYFSQEAERLQHGGFWSTSGGLKLVQDDLWKFDKFHNKVFNVTSLFLPIFHSYDLDSGGIKQWRGIAIGLLDALATSLNFTYKIYETPDKKWGGIDEDGKWNGMVNQVKEGFADFAVGKFTVSAIRDTVIDFTTPYWFEAAVMVMRRPKENKLLVFAKPLSNLVWTCMIASLPLMGATVFFTTYLHDEDVTRPCHRSNFGKIYKHFKRGMTYAYGAAMHQSLPWIPATLSLRVVFVFWWFSVIAMVAVYTGNLTAVLAVPRSPSPINTLDELAEQTAYKYGVVDSSALDGLFSSKFQDTHHVYKRLYDRSIQKSENLVTSHITGVQRALRKDYVYIGEYSGVTPYVFKDCRLIMGKQEFYPSSMALVFPENSPYLAVFNKRIMQLIDAGMVKYWRGQHYPKNKCSAKDSESNSREKKASLADTQGAFIVLLTGVLMSCFILLVEWILTVIFKDSYTPTEPEVTIAHL